jgi:hypothetical protein
MMCIKKGVRMENNCNCPQPLNVYNDICGLCLKQLKNKKSADEITFLHHSEISAGEYISAKELEHRLANAEKQLAHRDAEILRLKEFAESLQIERHGTNKLLDKALETKDILESEISRLRLALESIVECPEHCRDAYESFKFAIRAAREALTPTQKMEAE